MAAALWFFVIISAFFVTVLHLLLGIIGGGLVIVSLVTGSSRRSEVKAKRRPMYLGFFSGGVGVYRCQRAVIKRVKR